MKKTHWLRNTLIVLIVCGMAGTVLAAVLFSKDSNRTYVSASIQFSFDGSNEGRAPNGYPFDMNGFFADEVLSGALRASGLSDHYTVEQVRDNLTVTGVYPEKIVEEMTRYESLLDTTSDNQAAMKDYHATQYEVTLYNDFDKKIASGALTDLLGCIMTSYRTYFAKNYAVNLEKTEPITDLSQYDYAQQMEAISESVSQKIRYAEELKELAPDFQLNKKGFGDIIVRFENLQGDINRLNATIALNAVSIDRDRLQKRYEMEIRSQKIQQESLTEKLSRIEEQVNAYEKDGIIYVSANGVLTQVGTSTSETYDQLVSIRKKATDTLAKINAKIALYQARLDDMTGAAARMKSITEEEDAAAVEQLNKKELEALKTTVEQKIELLITKQETIVNDFVLMLDEYTAQQINEKTVSVTKARYTAPSLFSGSFAIKTIKTAGPLCAIGFMVCMVLLIISRRREEKMMLN